MEDHVNKHKQFFSGDCPGGGGLPTGWPGVNVYVLCAEPKQHKHFFPGPQLTGVTEKLFMCQIFMCPFWPLPKGPRRTKNTTL